MRDLAHARRTRDPRTAERDDFAKDAWRMTETPPGNNHGAAEAREISASVKARPSPLSNEDELEQAHVALEDMERHLERLAHENEQFQAQVRDEQHRRQAAEQRLRELDEALSAMTRKKDAQIELLHEKLATTLEELSVMSEELSGAKEMLEGKAQPSR